MRLNNQRQVLSPSKLLKAAAITGRTAVIIGGTVIPQVPLKSWPSFLRSLHTEKEDSKLTKLRVHLVDQPLIMKIKNICEFSALLF